MKSVPFPASGMKTVPFSASLCQLMESDSLSIDGEMKSVPDSGRAEGGPGSASGRTTVGRPDGS